MACLDILLSLIQKKEIGEKSRNLSSLPFRYIWGVPCDNFYFVDYFIF